MIEFHKSTNISFYICANDFLFLYNNTNFWIDKPISDMPWSIDNLNKRRMKLIRAFETTQKRSNW